MTTATAFAHPEEAARQRVDAVVHAVPRPLPPELAPVEAFPLAALPEALRPWVSDVTERMQCPPDFVGVPLLVSAASLAARHVVVRLRQHDDWAESANLWAMNVGRPGTMKSPAQSAGLECLRMMEAGAAEAFNEAVAQYQVEALTAKLRAEAQAAEAKKAIKKDLGADVSKLLRAVEESPEPTRRRYLVNAPTWEKLHALLAENPGGLCMVRDELAGWLREMGREENSEGRSFFVQGWSGGDFTMDRIGRGTITARDMRLSIIGAIQPGPLTQIIRASRGGFADDGLIERFLISWPDDPGAWRDIDRLPDGAARQRMRQAFERLESATPELLQAELVPNGMPFLRLDGSAIELFAEWRADLERRLRQQDGDAAESALAKFRHHVPALALTLHLVDGGIGPVRGVAMARALALGEYFESHARRLWSSGQRATVQAARAVLQKIREGALQDLFTARDVYRPQWSGLGDRAVVTDALELLTAHGWLNESTVESGGRPTAVYFLTEGARRVSVD